MVAVAAAAADLARGVSGFFCTCGCFSGGCRARRRQRIRRQIISHLEPEVIEPRLATCFAQNLFFRLCPSSLFGITLPCGIFPCCACTASDRMLAVVVLLEASIAIAIKRFHAAGERAGLALWTGLGPRRGAGVALWTRLCPRRGAGVALWTGLGPRSLNDEKQQRTTITMAIASASASAPASASASAAAATPASASACASASWPRSPLK